MWKRFFLCPKPVKLFPLTCGVALGVGTFVTVAHAANPLDNIISRQDFEKAYPSGMKLKDFADAMNITDPYSASLMFHAIDDHNGFIHASEWLAYQSIISSGTPQEKLHFQFQVFDVDGDGRITLEQLTELLKLHIRSGSIPVDVLVEHSHFWTHGKRTPKDLAEDLMKAAGVNHDNYIAEDEWERVCVYLIKLMKWREAHSIDNAELIRQDPQRNAALGRE